MIENTYWQPNTVNNNNIISSSSGSLNELNFNNYTAYSQESYGLYQANINYEQTNNFFPSSSAVYHYYNQNEINKDYLRKESTIASSYIFTKLTKQANSRPLKTTNSKQLNGTIKKEKPTTNPKKRRCIETSSKSIVCQSDSYLQNESEYHDVDASFSSSVSSSSSVSKQGGKHRRFSPRQRQVANQRERDRTHSVNSAFVQLRGLIPTG